MKVLDDIYNLYGVIEHYGTLNGGHYTAICKNNGKWTKYDDSKTYTVDSPISKNAYLLFYKSVYFIVPLKQEK